MHKIFAAVLGLAFIAASAPSVACIGPKAYEGELARWSRTPEEIDAIIDRSEIIVDGVISQYDSGYPQPEAMGGTVPARLRISRVWKGEVGAEVPIYMPIYLTGCTLPPQYDTPVRLAGRFYEGHLFYGAVTVRGSGTYGTMGLPVANVVLDQKLRAYRKPAHDSEHDRQMDVHRAKAEALRKAAATGDRPARLAYADYLRTNREAYRAIEIYESLSLEDPNDLDLLLKLAVARMEDFDRYEPETTLAEVAKRAPDTDEWRGKIARTRFAATGELSPGGKNWSDLKRTHPLCFSGKANFDGAVFDRVDLSGCAFRYSSFRSASFRGTDLNGSYFQNSDLTGAQYDCATKLPEDLDPVAAGMINVEGSCSKPASQ